MSLDSHVAAQPYRSPNLSLPAPTKEEDFEDVGLNDDSAKPKKRGFFGRFGDSNEQTQNNGHHSFHISGRRRGQSGTGQELGDMGRRPGSGH